MLLNPLRGRHELLAHGYELMTIHGVTYLMGDMLTEDNHYRNGDGTRVFDDFLIRELRCSFNVFLLPVCLCACVRLVLGSCGPLDLLRLISFES